MPARICICKQPAKHRMDSLSCCDQFGCKAVQTSCALAPLDPEGRAKRCSSGFSALFGKGNAPELHCACDPTLPKEGVCTLQKLGDQSSFLTNPLFCPCSVMRTLWATMSLAELGTNCCTPHDHRAKQLALCHHSGALCQVCCHLPQHLTELLSQEPW